MISTQDIPGLLEGILGFAGYKETSERRIVPLVRLRINLEAEPVIVATGSNVGDYGAETQGSVGERASRGCGQMGDAQLQDIAHIVDELNTLKTRDPIGRKVSV